MLPTLAYQVRNLSRSRLYARLVWPLLTPASITVFRSSARSAAGFAFGLYVYPRRPVREVAQKTVWTMASSESAHTEEVQKYIPVFERCSGRLDFSIRDARASRIELAAQSPGDGPPHFCPGGGAGRKETPVRRTPHPWEADTAVRAHPSTRRENLKSVPPSDFTRMKFYRALVLVAVITSQFAGAWLEYVLHRGWPLLSTDEKESQIACLACVTNARSRFPFSVFSSVRKE
jgi:hypothetical protein